MNYNNHIVLKNDQLDIDIASYISQHDVIFKTPAYKGYEGFTVGNGDLGIMVWTPPDCFKFQINKTNTWDDAPDGPFGAWDDGNCANQYTSLRHCCQVEIELGFPVFERQYLEDFEGRLCLSNGTAVWKSKTPFGQVNCSAFVSKNPKTIILQYEDELCEPTVRKINIMRYGSRVFEHWYADIKRSDLLGTGKTNIETAGNSILLTHKTRSLEFAVAAKVISASKITTQNHNRYEAGFEITAANKCAFTLVISVATSEESADFRENAQKQTEAAVSTDIEKIYAEHKKWWQNFWSASFIDIPNKYIENLWYLNLYQLASSSSGDYPPHFINSIWSWTRDARPWNHYYHWNQQCYTWPLLSSGHPELLNCYAKFRLNGLPKAQADAKSVHNCDGAFYADVCNRKGFQDIIEPSDYKPTCDTEYLKTYVVPSNSNLTPGAQIAHDLYRHYEYTGDEDFLKTYTYPILKGWVEFICGFIQKKSDGRYHITKSSPYEAVEIRCNDTTSVLAYVKLLFPIFCELAHKFSSDAKLADKADEIFKNLADYPKIELDGSSADTAHKNTKTTIIADGIEHNSNQPLYKDSPLMNDQYTIFLVCSQLTPVFPAGLVGIDKKNTSEFRDFVNTLKYNMPVEINGHTPTLNWIVRLGLSDIIEGQLIRWIQHHQLYPQGLWAYWARRYKPTVCQEEYIPNGFAADFLNVGACNKVKVLGCDEYVQVPKDEFAHIGLEAGCIFQAAVSDMLLAGHSNVITVFPAVPENWYGRFKLHAAGGFIVTSERINQTIAYVLVESKNGKTCRLTNPWTQCSVKITDLQTDTSADLSADKNNILSFSTRPNSKYLIENPQMPIKCFDHIKLTAEPAAACRQSGQAVIGKPKQY